jgi:hypothetical protein
MRDRNPYVELGIEFGASREEANFAFAAKARPLKRRQREDASAHDSLIELTWALNQIDEAITDPDSAIDVYRIPADPLAFEPEGAGLFAPAPVQLERQSTESEADLARLYDSAVRELIVGIVLACTDQSALPPA